MRYNRNAAMNRKKRASDKEILSKYVQKNKNEKRIENAKRMGFSSLGDVREVYGRLKADELRRTGDLT